MASVAMVCIKIGENEPEMHPEFAKLSKHLDIIEVLPRKRDKTGRIIERTMGYRGDKEYLGLNVDMSHLDDKEFAVMRIRLKKRLHPDAIDNTRLYCFDTTRASFLSPETSTAIDGQATKKRSIKPMVYKYVLDYNESEGKEPGRELVTEYQKMLPGVVGFDMTVINRFDKVVSFSDFANAVINNKTGQSLAEELL